MLRADWTTERPSGRSSPHRFITQKNRAQPMRMPIRFRIRAKLRMKSDSFWSDAPSPRLADTGSGGRSILTNSDISASLGRISWLTMRGSISSVCPEAMRSKRLPMEKSSKPKGMLRIVKSNGSTRSFWYRIKFTCQSISNPKSPTQTRGNHRRFILFPEDGDGDSASLGAFIIKRVIRARSIQTMASRMINCNRPDRE